jgi:hypothetical protein
MHAGGDDLDGGDLRRLDELLEAEFSELGWGAAAASRAGAAPEPAPVPADAPEWAAELFARLGGLEAALAARPEPQRVPAVDLAPLVERLAALEAAVAAVARLDVPEGAAGDEALLRAVERLDRRTGELAADVATRLSALEAALSAIRAALYGKA